MGRAAFHLQENGMSHENDESTEVRIARILVEYFEETTRQMEVLRKAIQTPDLRAGWEFEFQRDPNGLISSISAKPLMASK